MNRDFRAARVWRLLRANPGWTAKHIAEHLQARQGPISTLLVRMATRGQAQRGDHHGRHTQWFALGKCPEDRRGCHVNSLRNLTHEPEQNASRLRKANAAQGRDPDKMGRAKPRKPRPYYTGELERCWSIPFSRTQEAGD